MSDSNDSKSPTWVETHFGNYCDWHTEYNGLSAWVGSEDDGQWGTVVFNPASGDCWEWYYESLEEAKAGAEYAVKYGLPLTKSEEKSCLESPGLGTTYSTYLAFVGAFSCEPSDDEPKPESYESVEEKTPTIITITEAELARSLWEAREDVQMWALTKCERAENLSRTYDVAWSRHEPKGSREEAERMALAVAVKHHAG